MSILNRVSAFEYFQKSARGRRAVSISVHGPGRDRATEFGQRCKKLWIKGVTLHSYRYAWAERAKVVGMPERFAQAALGHNSKAIHRAYAKKAIIVAPSLEEYETKAAAATQQKLVAA